MKNLRNSKGFTLIELMIVVVIIGILAAIAIPKFTSVSNGAKQAEAAPILKQMCTLADAVQLKDGSYPADLTALTGWAEPNAKYFTFSYAGTATTATATATPRTTTGTNLVIQNMDCITKNIT